MENKSKRDLKFTASRITELLAGGTGKTRMNYIYDIAIEHLGLKDEFITEAMEHGVLNQVEAFERAFKPQYSGEWFDEFVLINDKCGASPDVCGDGFVADMKCNYTQNTFEEQSIKLLKKFEYQSVMQQMAIGVDIGYVCHYFCCNTKMCAKEYCGGVNCINTINIADRHHIHTIKRSEQIEHEILEAVDKYYPDLLALVELLKNAEELSIVEKYYNTKVGGIRYVKLKDINFLKVDSCVLCDGDFYTEKR